MEENLQIVNERTNYTLMILNKNIIHNDNYSDITLIIVNSLIF